MAGGASDSSDVRSSTPAPGVEPPNEEQSRDRPTDPLLGQEIDGRYRLVSVLGRGGVGAVYRATRLNLTAHQSLDSAVAVKVLHGPLDKSEELRARFEREAQTLSALRHPNVVAINDYGLSNEKPYLVMELLSGRTLAHLLDNDGAPPLSDALAIIRGVLRGLAFAHQHGVVHRDLKAANVFLVDLPDTPHHVKLLDFGLAKVLSTEDGEGDPSLTAIGTILGTPAYMSPEQAAGEKTDARTDVYSAGVLLYELLTGRFPFVTKTRSEMLRAHLSRPVPDPDSVRPGLRLGPELREIVLKSLGKARGGRFPSAQEMLEAIDRLPVPAATFDLSAEGLKREARRERSDAPTIERRSAPESKRWGGRRPIIWFAAIGCALAVSGGLVVLWMGAPKLGTGAPGSEASAVQVPSAEPGSLPSPAAALDHAVDSQVTNEGDSPPSIDRELPAGAASPAAGAPAVGEPPTTDDMTFGAEEAVDRPPPHDPFRAGSSPALSRLRQKVRRGRSLEQNERQSLMAIQRTSPGDPRPSLILAHHFVNITYYSDALERYEAVHVMDPAARGNTVMRDDLLRMVGSPAVTDRAIALVLHVYGAEVRAAAEAAQAREDSPDAVAGLERLLRALESHDSEL